MAGGLSAFFFDPVSETYTPTTDLPVPQYCFGRVILSNGSVFISSGHFTLPEYHVFSDSLIFDTASETYTRLADVSTHGLKGRTMFACTTVTGGLWQRQVAACSSMVDKVRRTRSLRHRLPSTFSGHRSTGQCFQHKTFPREARTWELQLNLCGRRIDFGQSKEESLKLPPLPLEMWFGVLSNHT
eukprot:m.110249 g.110249  ORF g.110249 m.110249 type:complete len:185 (-) comp12881_c0_seq2:1701-2255(-)